MIFAPGFTTKFNQEGFAATGIGLSHVRDIVHSLGGDIHLRSDEPSSQTTFVITYIDRYVEKRSVEIMLSFGIVDDDAVSRLMLQKIIEKGGLRRSRRYGRQRQ